jgi:AP-1 complex subunit gamma-1
MASLCHLQADLLGDDLVAAPAASVNSVGSGRTNEDLLADIFGSSAPSAAAPSGTSNGASDTKSKVDDILSLFGPTPTTSSAAPSSSPATTIPAQSAFSLAQTQSPPPPPPASRLIAFTAYEKNGLRITLTPQTSAAKPGYISIQARFQTTGASAVTGLVFQAAVPRVRRL